MKPKRIKKNFLSKLFNVKQAWHCQGCGFRLYAHQRGRHELLFTERDGRGRRHYKNKCNFVMETDSHNTAGFGGMKVEE